MSSIADGYPRVAFETLVGDGGSDSKSEDSESSDDDSSDNESYDSKAKGSAGKDATEFFQYKGIHKVFHVDAARALAAYLPTGTITSAQADEYFDRSSADGMYLTTPPLLEVHLHLAVWRQARTRTSSPGQRAKAGVRVQTSTTTSTASAQ